MENMDLEYDISFPVFCVHEYIYVEGLQIRRPYYDVKNIGIVGCIMIKVGNQEQKETVSEIFTRNSFGFSKSSSYFLKRLVLILWR